MRNEATGSGGREVQRRADEGRPLPRTCLVALWMVIDKTERENLTKAERDLLAARVAAYLEALDETLGRRSGR